MKNITQKQSELLEVFKQAGILNGVLIGLNDLPRFKNCNTSESIILNIIEIYKKKKKQDKIIKELEILKNYANGNDGINKTFTYAIEILKQLK
jgi:hypothetical protein